MMNRRQLLATSAATLAMFSGVPRAFAATYDILVKNGRVIDPSVGGNEARWINHSCDPNCETIEDHRGRVFINAIRSIRTGEELFYDYHLEVDDHVPRTKEIEDEARCTCGSPKCRGTLLALAD